MDPPPPPAPPLSANSTVPLPPAPTHNLPYPDSVDSSPRSRNTDSWDDPPYPGGAPLYTKLRLMCSYGGHIVPRPHDKSLCYVGGDTRIVVVDRLTSLSDLTNRLSKTLLDGRSFTLKYQLPNEDLDSLISVTTDEDLEIMIDEYDRLNSTTTNTTAPKSSRLRLFLFSTKPESGSSIGSLLENSTKSEDWFLNALNGASRGFSDSSSVNCLLGLDDDIVANTNTNSAEKGVEAQIESFGIVKGVSGGSSNKQSQDVHSVPDSPMLETTSSFGSTSSSPSPANLPPIRVRMEDQKIGIEEQFTQMNIGSGANVPQQKQDDGGYVVLSKPPTILATVAAATVVTGVPIGAGGVVGEYPNRVFSDDERSEQGLPVGYRRSQQAQAQSQPQLVPTQLQQKPAGGVDLASPDSVSSDGSVSNPLSRQKPMIYQDQIVRIPSGNSRVSANPVDPKITDPNTRVQLQQVQDPGYLLSTQFDQQQLQLHQQPQFVHTSTQYLHHQPTGSVPISSYYSVYPPQHQHQHQPHPHLPSLDQQYPVYYMHVGPSQPYNLPVQQPSYNEAAAAAPSTGPQTPPPASMVPTPASFNPVRNAPKPEMATGVYRTAAAAAPQLVQVPASQHQQQYVGFSQIHHPSQSIAHTSAATATYAYDFADHAHAQMYYTQSMAPQMAAQYQTMASAPAVALPEASAQFATENVKHQVRTSQP